MESCIECGSINVGELEYDSDCEGCCLVECEDCGIQFERAEMVGIDHEGCDR